MTHEKTLNLYNETSISVAPSFWEEPFGRTAMEAASRGCATIISKKGGLIETIPNALYLSNLNDCLIAGAVQATPPLTVRDSRRISLQIRFHSSQINWIDSQNHMMKYLVHRIECPQ